MNILLSHLVRHLISGFTRVLTRVKVYGSIGLEPRVRVYFANHSSHGDFALLFACLPRPLQARTRPVAAADYWLAGAVRRWLIMNVFNGVLIKREASEPGPDPVWLMSDVLSCGDSLILFPEGTRHQGTDLLPFRSGLYHLANNYPGLELVPVWIANMDKVLPKGAYLPRPVRCQLAFGEALWLQAGEDRLDFLLRAKQALLDTQQLLTNSSTD